MTVASLSARCFPHCGRSLTLPQFGIVAPLRYRARRSVPHWASSSLFPALRALAYAPQAAGFSSAGLSAAPQAAGCSAGLSAAPQVAPHAAGFFSSAGLSAAPQAAPQAAAGAICTRQEARFFRAMVSSSLINLEVSSVADYNTRKILITSTHLFVTT